jgi:hypothetical protein
MALGLKLASAEDISSSMRSVTLSLYPARNWMVGSIFHSAAPAQAAQLVSTRVVTVLRSTARMVVGL